MKLTQVKRTVIDNVPIGMFIIEFELIWGSNCNEGEHSDCLEHGCLDNEPSYVSDIEPIIVKLNKKNYVNHDYLKALNTNDQVDGDTFDLRPKLFKTKREAQEYVNNTIKRFQNPRPWECFVKY